MAKIKERCVTPATRRHGRIVRYASAVAIAVLLILCAVFMLSGCTNYENGASQSTPSDGMGPDDDGALTLSGDIPETDPSLGVISFSHEPGRYTDAFTLTLSCREGMTVYYTLDGSDPTNSATRSVYKYPIPVSDTSAVEGGTAVKLWKRRGGDYCAPADSKLPGLTVVRAVGIDDQNNISTPVSSASYFVWGDGSLFPDTVVVSLQITASDAFGKNGFYSNYCPTGEITDKRPRGLASMEVFDRQGKRVGVSDVELAVSGNGSSGTAMKSLRVYYKKSNNEGTGRDSELNFDLFSGYATDYKGDRITSFSRLLLRNSGNDCGSSYMRDAFMQRACASLCCDTMAATVCCVFIDGSFWGFYNIRERYSPEYFAAHYGIKKENITIIESDYSQVHTNTNAPFVLSNGEEGDQDAFNQLVRYMKRNDLSDDANYRYVCSQMDIASFIDMYVARLYFNARDWPENNIKVWKNKNPDDPSGFDTKWHFTLLDMDMGLSFYDFTSASSSIYDLAFNRNSVCACMMDELMDNDEFRQLFYYRYNWAINELFAEENLKPIFEEMVSERQKLMSYQALRWPGDGADTGTFNEEVKKMRSFLNKRPGLAKRQFYAYFDISKKQLTSDFSEFFQ